jgi:LysR family transcriptional regulator, transcriptional activator of nhaA
VLSDAPIGAGVSVKAFNHLLGECSVSVMGVHALVAPRRAKFPHSLDDAPLLMPSDAASMRRALDGWFAAEGFAPDVVGEFDDSALLKVFGGDGEGLFVVPTVIEQEVASQYGVELLGRIDAVRERFYAISVERRVKHPAVAAICEAARSHFFA